MASPAAGWYVDPDPVPKAPHPVRWWDGERWGDQQAWYRGQWVHQGSRFAGYQLFYCQHPFAASVTNMLVCMLPILIAAQVTTGWEMAELLRVIGWALLLGWIAGFLNRRPGRKPRCLPPPPTQPPRGRGPERRPIVA